MQEVNRLTVDGGRELGERIQPRFLLPPIVILAPVLGEPLEVIAGNPPAPANVRQLAGPARAGQAVMQVIEVGLRNVDAEGRTSSPSSVGAFAALARFESTTEYSFLGTACTRDWTPATAKPSATPPTNSTRRRLNRARNKLRGIREV